MFGSEAFCLAWRLGYTLGFRIVQAYLKANPALTWKYLLDIDPWEIYEYSQVQGTLNVPCT